MQAWTDSDRRAVEKVKPLGERERKARIATLDWLIGEALKADHECDCLLAGSDSTPHTVSHTPRAAVAKFGGQCSCWTRKAATWLKLERFNLLTLEEREQALKEIGL